MDFVFVVFEFVIDYDCIKCVVIGGCEDVGICNIGVGCGIRVGNDGE